MKSRKEQWKREALLLDMAIRQISSIERESLLLEPIREGLIFQAPKDEGEGSVLETTRGLLLRIYRI